MYLQGIKDLEKDLFYLRRKIGGTMVSFNEQIELSNNSAVYCELKRLENNLAKCIEIVSKAEIVESYPPAIESDYIFEYHFGNERIDLVLEALPKAIGTQIFDKIGSPNFTISLYLYQWNYHMQIKGFIDVSN